MKTSGARLTLCTIIVLALVCFANAAYPTGDASPVFRAGAAISNITPPLGSTIVGNFETPKASYIHDDLHARCLVLDDGIHRMAIVICDNLDIDQAVYDQAKKRIAELAGIPIEYILTASTHTHSGAAARQGRTITPDEKLTDYQQFIANRIVDGVQCALHNLEPAEIGWGRAEEASQVFNRRWIMSDPSLMMSPWGQQDQARMNPPGGHPALVKPAGPTDPGILFLAVRTTAGRPIALLANYSLHYVGGVPPGDISADYYAAFADRIQALLGADRLSPPFVGILSNGTSGDINNIDHAKPRPTREPYTQIQFVANLIADDVFRAYQSITFQPSAQLDARLTPLTLEVRKPTDAMLEWARNLLTKPEDQTTIVERSYANRINQQQQYPATIDVPIQTLRIGDLGIAAIPFETFAETGLQIKKESPLPYTFTISHANGAYGYLPTPAQHELGGYETWIGTNRVAPNAEPAITAAILKQLNELTGK